MFHHRPIIYWYGKASKCNLNLLERVVKSVQKMGCTEISNLNEVYSESIREKVEFLINDTNFLHNSTPPSDYKHKGAGSYSGQGGRIGRKLQGCYRDRLKI